MFKKLFFCFCLITLTSDLFAQKNGFLYSSDSVKVYFDEYFVSKKFPVILLFHQARSSRGEYIEVAKKLNTLGINCVAIDLRSGDKSNSIENKTHFEAIQKNKSVNYSDAEKDIVASLNFFHSKYKKRISLLGSSYSASLILKIAVSEKHKIKTLFTFSPGEYFNGFNLSDYIKGLEVLTFIYGAKSELSDIEKCTSGLINKKTFRPTGEGRHGASVLWTEFQGNAEYWKELEEQLKFLKFI